jgi:hypothetical protein
MHPAAYLERDLISPNGTEINIPPLGLADLRREIIGIIEEFARPRGISGLAPISVPV